MKISYQRGIRHNYMIIDPEELVWEGYESRMLSANSIEGLLHFQIRQQEEGVQLLYEITSRQPLSRLLEGRKIQAKEIHSLVSGVLKVLERMEGYLLGENHILLEPEYLYVEPESLQVWLCLVPGLEQDFPEKFGKFLEYLLECVDHGDKESVILAYGLYQETRKENYGMDDIFRLLCRDQRMDSPKSREGWDRQNSQEIRDQVRSELSGIADIAGSTVDFPSGKSRKETAVRGNEGREKTPADRNSPLARLRLWFREHFFHEKESAPVQVPWEMMFREEEDRGSRAEVPVQGKSGSHRRNAAEQNVINRVGGDRKQEKGRLLVREALVEPGNASGQGLEFGTALLADLSGQTGTRRLRALDSENEDITISYYPFVIGKQENLVDYQLKQDTVSRLHVRIDQKEDGYQIQDLNSTNGTCLKGRLLENNEAAALSVGDEIRIANCRYLFE